MFIAHFKINIVHVSKGENGFPPIWLFPESTQHNGGVFQHRSSGGFISICIPFPGLQRSEWNILEIKNRMLKMFSPVSETGKSGDWRDPRKSPDKQHQQSVRRISGEFLVYPRVEWQLKTSFSSRIFTGCSVYGRMIAWTQTTMGFSRIMNVSTAKSHLWTGRHLYLSFVSIMSWSLLVKKNFSSFSRKLGAILGRAFEDCIVSESLFKLLYIFGK